MFGSYLAVFRQPGSWISIIPYVGRGAVTEGVHPYIRCDGAGMVLQLSVLKGRDNEVFWQKSVVGLECFLSVVKLFFLSDCILFCIFTNCFALEWGVQLFFSQ